MTGVDRERLLRDLYAAFNARNVDSALAGLTPDVDWPNGMEGGRELGRDAVRAYWTRQFGLIDSQVEPARFTLDEEGRTAVEVHQVVRDPSGTLLVDRTVQHVYTFRGDLVERMDIVEL